MIINNKIEIKTTNKNIGHYNGLGYNVKSGDSIIIFVTDLPKTSKHKIEVSCDECKNEYKISYFSYLRNIKDDVYHCKHCSGIRTKETNIKKYGVDHPLKLEEFKNKSKKTCLNKYGVEYSMQNKEVKEKFNNTIKDKYGELEYMSTDDFKDKSKTTLNKIYGVDSPLQNNDIKLKVQKTCLERYLAKSPFESILIKKKISDTKKERYDDEFYNNRQKYKETCLNKYGVGNPMQNEIIRQKLSNIIFEKYGVFYPAQNSTIYEKMIKSGYQVLKYMDYDIYYQGEYEYDFLNKYYDKIDIKRGKPIKYMFNNIEHIYYPDFFIEKINLIVEIKSSYWFNKHLEKNLLKELECKKLGYNFIFILDKDYEIFDKMINKFIYNKSHSWQYDIRINNLENDVKNLKFDYKKLKISDFKFEYIDKNDNRTKNIVDFIKKYEWLGKMPNRPTHRFIASYDNIICGAIVMSTPNSFSKMLGDDTHKIEKLISRGACASWTPKNLASSLLMWSIKWMSKNTEFRIFEAYADTEAKELGTIYQACNFYYLGDSYGSDKLYFDPKNPNRGWTSSRGFRKLNFYKSYLRSKNIIWNDDWNKKTTILWDKIPDNISEMLKKYSIEVKNRCYVRKTNKKHKYVYILGSNKKQTKYLRKQFEIKNNYFLYPKDR